MEEDKTLKYLEQYHGTQQYHRLFMGNINATDGIKYIVDNGYHWFASDVSVILMMKLRSEEFVAITLVVNEDKKAVVTYTNGNEKVLYTQKYNYTDAKVDKISLYFTNGVMMLSGEY